MACFFEHTLKTHIMKKQGNKKSTPAKNGTSKSISTTSQDASGRHTKSKSNGKSAGNSEDMESALHDFFLDGIKDIYWAEKHLTKALPKMAKAATSEELQEAFQTHLEQTKGHITKLEKVFQLLDEKVQAKKCDGMEGLVKEGEKCVEETEDGTMTRDAGLIVSAQKVEHYEIASYGSLAQLARTMGHDDVAEILGQILDEEKDTDVLLTGLAESHINIQATHEEA